MANTLYNNGFPMGYTYYQSQPPIVAQQPSQRFENNNVFTWVMGSEGAKSFLLGPNQTVFLMDSENPYFYIKKSDQNGMPISFQTFEYKEIVPSTETNKTESVPTINVEKIEKQLKSLNTKITELENQILDIATSPKKRDDEEQ